MYFAEPRRATASRAGTGSGLGAALTANHPRTKVACVANERRILRVIEPPPSQLATIDSRHLTDPVSGPKQLHTAAYAAFQRLKAAAEADGLPRNILTIISGYRGVAKQRELWARALERYGSPQAARQWVAPPGGSPHHTGRAIDFYLGTRNDSGNIEALRATDAYRWMVCNAERFGFTPYINEPWHWEYNPPGFVPEGGLPSQPVPPVQPPPGPGARVGGDPGARAVADAIARGTRDIVRLTNLAFFARHPERAGRPITAGDAPAGAEWRTIRQTIVVPALQRANGAR